MTATACALALHYVQLCSGTLAPDPCIPKYMALPCTALVLSLVGTWCPTLSVAWRQHVKHTELLSSGGAEIGWTVHELVRPARRWRHVRRPAAVALGSVGRRSRHCLFSFL